MRRFETESADETIAAGEVIARTLPEHCAVLLIGNLGAGKTTLAKGIAKGRGAAEADEVSSPTFTLVHQYGAGQVYHVDLYRLENAAEVSTIGLEEIFERKAIVLVEWGERFPDLMPPDRIEIRIRMTGDDRREIVIAP